MYNEVSFFFQFLHRLALTHPASQQMNERPVDPHVDCHSNGVA
jgi:hypothetical protein